MDTQTKRLGLISFAIVGLLLLLILLFVSKNSAKSTRLSSPNDKGQVKVDAPSKTIDRGGQNRDDGHSYLNVIPILLALFFIAALAASFLLFLIINRCPKCKKIMHYTKPIERVSNRERTFGLVTRCINSRSFAYIPGTPNHRGKVVPSIGKSTWQERAPIIRETVVITHGCRFCSFSTEKTVVREYEDFERE